MHALAGCWLKWRGNLPRQIKVRNHGTFLNLNHRHRETCCIQKLRKFMEFLQLESRTWPHHFHTLTVVLHMEKVYSIVRQICGRSPTDNLNDLDVSNAVWGIFMNVTLRAALHIGRDFFGESTIYQESTPKVCETVIPSD